MRNAFANTLTHLAAHDKRIVLLSGDIGNRLFDKFKAAHPDRFYNCGIAEASMMSIASGLAMNGLRPFVYTITPFITARCLEQIRLDACYHHQPIVIVGVGAGLSYASLGATHHSCEDIAQLRTLPGMTVICPADAVETSLSMHAVLELAGPSYLRMGKKGEPVVHAQPPDFAIGRGIVVREGDDVCLLGTGTILPVVLDAADELTKRGITARVVSMHTVKPLDEILLANAFARFNVVATIEEHSILGGFGGAVGEWLVDQQCQATSLAHLRARLLRIGTPDAFLHEAGSQDYARARFGLTAEAIASRVQQAYLKSSIHHENARSGAGRDRKATGTG